MNKIIDAGGYYLSIPEEILPEDAGIKPDPKYKITVVGDAHCDGCE